MAERLSLPGPYFRPDSFFFLSSRDLDKQKRNNESSGRLRKQIA